MSRLPLHFRHNRHNWNIFPKRHCDGEAVSVAWPSLITLAIELSTSGCPEIMHAPCAMLGCSRIFGNRAVRFDPFLPGRSDFNSGPRTLLCEQIPLPTVPAYQAGVGSLATLWRRAEEAIELGSSWDACQIFLVAMTNQDVPPRRILQFLFEAAFRLMSVGDQTAAERCLQKSLGLLACQTDASVSDSLTVQWLVLASSGLLRDDLDSCELWLRQAQRAVARLMRDNPSDATHRFAGDCFSIHACMAARSEDVSKPIALLTQALECHTRANAAASAAQDLLLRSRCYLREHNWSTADADLAEAEALVRVVYDRRDASDCQRILSAVLFEKATLRAQRLAIGVARWN